MGEQESRWWWEQRRRQRKRAGGVSPTMDGLPAWGLQAFVGHVADIEAGRLGNQVRGVGGGVGGEVVEGASGGLWLACGVSA